MGAIFKIALGVAASTLGHNAIFFHSSNQPMINKKLQEKIKWEDQVYNCKILFTLVCNKRDVLKQEPLNTWTGRL